jgi:O-6-methylguanine DNA methyltransferase
MKKTFSDKVRDIVRKIPKGKTMTYKEVATKAGNPKAARAVGAVMRSNYDPSITLPSRRCERREDARLQPRCAHPLIALPVNARMFSLGPRIVPPPEVITTLRPFLRPSPPRIHAGRRRQVRRSGAPDERAAAQIANACRAVFWGGSFN